MNRNIIRLPGELKNNKTMKKQMTLLLAALIFPVLLNAQDMVQSLLDEFEGRNGITTVIVSKNLFTILSAAKFDDPEVNYWTKNLDEIKVFSISDKYAFGEDFDLFNHVMNKIDKSAYKELLRAREDDEEVIIWAKDDGKGHVTELMIVAGEENEDAVISITGNIDFDKVTALSSSMHIHKSMQHLEEIDEEK